MASAGSFEAPSSVDANQQRETITCMDQAFFRAAAEGSIQVFRNAQKPLNSLLTPNKNTILHIYLTAIYITEKRSLKTKLGQWFHCIPPQTPPQTATNFVGGILDICPSLLWKYNARCETLLHIAARNGHAAIVKALIQRIKDHCIDLERQANETRRMLRMLNKEKDTALHEAVRYNHLEVVRLLLAKEDPNFIYSSNDADETLLYMAVERGFRDVVFEILGTCNSPAYTGPLGRTALHAAVFWNDAEIIEKLIDKIATLAKIPDQKGWTPLHLAAYFGCRRAAEALLRRDGQVAYMKDTEDRTALHVAVGMSNRGIVRMILSHYPDCCEIIDKNGRKILHFSVESRSPNPTTKLLLKYPFVSNLLNEKDDYGNTALLHHFKSPHHPAWSLLKHPRVDKMAFNNQHLNVLDIALAAGRLLLLKRGMNYLKRSNRHLRPSRRVLTGKDYIAKSKNEEEETEYKGRGTKSRMEERAHGTHLVVATLITTVTFQAGITMPGGFNTDSSDLGTVTLAGKWAFKAFGFADTLAFLLSSWAVFVHMLLPLPLLRGTVFKALRRSIATSATRCIVLALIAMVLAFIMGIYAVLEQHYWDISLVSWTVAAIFFSIIGVEAFAVFVIQSHTR